MDRVLNHRGGVRPSTVNDIRQAIADLDRQRSQLRLNGRVFMIDIVMQTPDRFSSAVKAALEQELPSLRPAVVRSRFDFREKGHVHEIVKLLDTIVGRGSRGVILKAPEAPEVNAAVLRLSEAGIPVVTLVSVLAVQQAGGLRGDGQPLRPAPPRRTSSTSGWASSRGLRVGAAHPGRPEP